MTTIYYNKLTPSTVTATDAAAAYPASNAMLESIVREWRSANIAAKDVVIDMGASVAIDSLFLHAVNFATATIARSVDNVTYTAVGNLAAAAGRHGRRRGRITIGAAARYLKITTPAAGPTDNATFWRIGSAYVFASKVTPGATPNYPAKATTTRPRISTALVNKKIAVATTGVNMDDIALPVPRFSGESADDFIQRALAGSIVIDLEEPNYPEQIWPVQHIEEQVTESFDSTVHSDLTLTFREIV